MAILEDRGSPEFDDPGSAVGTSAPLLHDGQKIDQPTFHELYQAMPEDFRAELIDGTVYAMSSPVHPDHGRPDFNFSGFLYLYCSETPGTNGQGNTTSKLGPQSEVQPDYALFIDPDCGGQTEVDEKGYSKGCPELVVEIASSSLTLDLGQKMKVYEQAGALEYVVFDVPHRAIRWFALEHGRFEPVPVNPDGPIRSRTFLGLWLDVEAFLRGDRGAVNRSLRVGLDSPEHAAFVERLRQYRANRP